MAFFSNWLVGFGLTATAKKLLSVFERGLADRLETVIKEWMDGLPEESALASSQALLPQPNARLLENPPPEPEELFKRKVGLREVISRPFGNLKRSWFVTG